MIRWQIDMPRQHSSGAVVTSRDQVKNLIDTALTRHGYTLDRKRPVRYGFGVIAKRIPATASRRLYRIERIFVGSADPEISQIMEQWSPKDLVEPNAVPGAGLNLSSATMTQVPSPVLGEALAVYAISPIRVLEGNPSRTILELGPKWEKALNQTMTRRFDRPFHLHVIPDSFYIRSRHGDIVAKMAIKVKNDGYVVAYPGLVFPFVLTGPKRDLDIAWHSGLGSSTGMGFGCMEVAQ